MEPGHAVTLPHAYRGRAPYVDTAVELDGRSIVGGTASLRIPGHHGLRGGGGHCRVEGALDLDEDGHRPFEPGRGGAASLGDHQHEVVVREGPGAREEGGAVEALARGADPE